MIFLFVKKLVCIFKCFFGTYFFFIFSRFYLLLLISLEPKFKMQFSKV